MLLCLFRFAKYFVDHTIHAVAAEPPKPAKRYARDDSSDGRKVGIALCARITGLHGEHSVCELCFDSLELLRKPRLFA